MINSKNKNDIILVVTVILLALIALIFFWFFTDEGSYVVISIDGAEVSRYPLNENFKTDIVSQDGKVNTLVIDSGKAYISYAECPDKICVAHRKISREGETIVCLPHKLVIGIDDK